MYVMIKLHKDCKGILLNNARVPLPMIPHKISLSFLLFFTWGVNIAKTCKFVTNIEPKPWLLLRSSHVVACAGL